MKTQTDLINIVADLLAPMLLERMPRKPADGGRPPKVESKRARRGGPPKVESYADWMARTDTEVEAMAQQVCSRLPAERLLNQHQRRILEMLVEHMRSLPPLAVGEDAYEKPEYAYMNGILCNLFQAKYPSWTQETKDGSCDVDMIPNGEGLVFHRLLRNCAGRAPQELADWDDGED